MQAKSKIEYNPRIDGLRAVAIILVLLSHFQFRNFLGGGTAGVVVFFVLSGYLITKVLSRDFEDKSSLFVFYWRRFIRLMPALIFLSATYVLYSTLFTNNFLSTKLALTDAIASIFYISNWTRIFIGPTPMYLGNTWSLAIEEQFYLIWPSLFWILMSTKGRKKFTLLAVFGLLVMAIWWTIRAEKVGWLEERIYNGFDTRFNALLLGCFMALMSETLKGEKILKFFGEVWPIGIIILIYIVTLRKIETTNFASLMTSVATLLILSSINYDKSSILSKLLGSNIFVYIGKISYGLYLWHYPIWYILLSYGLSWWSIVSIGMPLSFLMAVISYEIIEKNVTKLRNLPYIMQIKLGSLTVSFSILGMLIAGSFFLFKPIKNMLSPIKFSIIDYEPKTVGVGSTFNVQADGNSYFIMKTSQILPDKIKIKVNDKVYDGVSRKDVAGVLIPKEIIQRVGEHRIILKTVYGTDLANQVFLRVVESF